MYDNEIMGNNDEESMSSYRISAKCFKEYTEIETRLTKSDVLDIIKNNTKKTFKDINRKVLDLIKLDSEFQKLFLEHTVT
jgi:hypothetical protein